MLDEAFVEALLEAYSKYAVIKDYVDLYCERYDCSLNKALKSDDVLLFYFNVKDFLE